MRSFLLRHKALWATLLIACVTRLVSVDWDAGQHLHPDERFLTMVTVAMQVPASLGTYLNARTSSLNPANLDFSFFVYGLFPLVLVKLLSIASDMDTYMGITQVGRMVSAVFDMGTVIGVYVMGRTLALRYTLKPSIAGYAAFLYAVAVLPIQLSHFYATDTFMLSLMVLALAVLSYCFTSQSRPFWFGVSAILYGLAIASKITAIYVAPLIGLILLDAIRNSRTKKPIRSIVWQGIGLGLLYGLISYMTLRGAYPYMFQESQHLWDPRPAQAFVDSLKTLKSYDDPSGYFPPAIQWMSRDIEWVSPTQPSALRMVSTIGTSLSYGIVQGVLVGFGLVASALAIVGFVYIIRARRWFFLTFGAFAAGFVVYQSLQFVKSPRYFVVSYPFLALLGGYGIQMLLDTRHRTHEIIRRSILFLALVLPALFFLSIYQYPHTRNTASAWMYDHLPAGSTILWEYWDDPLPLSLPMEKSHGVQFVGQDFHVFAIDDEAKWLQMTNQLSTAQYYVMSSNRGWGSVLRVPEKYPLMSRVYRDLLNPYRTHFLLCGTGDAYRGLGTLTSNEQNIASAVCSARLDYRLIYKATSYPSLRYLGIPMTIPDQWLDEAYTVYDHPKVMIFQNNATLPTSR